MGSRKKLWIWLAIGGSLLINVGILGIASLLSHERGKKDDITNPVAVNLVELAPPVPAEPPEIKEKEKPKPQEKSNFTPELVRPQLNRAGQLDAGIVMNLQGVSAADLAEDFVFEAFELDQPPQVLVRIPPAYPYKAREQVIEGAVQVKMLINTQGTVEQVMILDARPKGIFEDSVLQCVPKWKFSPGKIEGETVTAWVVTTIRFEL